MTREAIDEDREVEDIIERLSARFPSLSTATVTEAVTAARSSFERAKVRDFVPVLIEREARARLENPL